MTKQEEIYEPLLREFCSEIKQYYKKINISGLFLANSMPKYEESNNKFFYIGQDTYWWTDFNMMIEQCTSNRVKEYINENNKWLTPKNIISQSSNNAGSFWTMVIRLHIFLKTNELVNVNKLSNEQINLLNSIGWGNLNSIEVPKTLQNEERWNEIDKNYYRDIKNRSGKFDKLKLILDIYDPDILFVFNWCDDNKFEQVSEGLELECNEETYIQNILATYRIKDRKTKIIWSSHPNKLKYEETNINNIIEIIQKSYKK
jgi:hypothetical protein